MKGRTIKEQENIEIYFIDIPDSWISDCFSKNATLTSIKGINELARWYSMLNRICIDIGAGPLLRRSVPPGRMQEEDIQKFLQELKVKSEPWKTMKIVVLGHGRIGKTTLLAAIRKLIAATFQEVI